MLVVMHMNTSNVEWRTRKRGTEKQIGQRFPVYPKPDKSSLPRDITVVSVPEYSELHPSMKDKVKETVRKAKEKVRELEEEEQAEQFFTEEEILEAGRKELEEELGLEPDEYYLTDDDEITVETIRRTPREPEKEEDEIDYAEHLRRLAEFKRTKGLSSVT